MSRILDNVHEDMSSLHDAGLLNAEDMRTFDAMCLPEVKSLSPAQIKRLRTANNASQAVFAMVLNTSVSTIRQWERGAKTPNGLAMKLLNLVQGKGLQVLLEE